MKDDFLELDREQNTACGELEYREPAEIICYIVNIVAAVPFWTAADICFFDQTRSTDSLGNS